jgi:hypothetical protein
MSHNPHGATGQPAGTISMGVKVALVLGVMASIMQGMFVGLSSGYGRVWPSINSTRVQLPPTNFNP